MKAKRYHTEALLRIVGEERRQHGADEVSAADKELVRRLGGTRQQRKLWDRVRGVLGLAAGLPILGLGAAALLAGFGTRRGLIEPGHLSPTAGLLACALALAAGGVLVLSGFALLAGWKPKGWLGWVVQKLTRHDAAINREGPWPEDLVRVIGSERRSHSEVRVQDAWRHIGDMYAERLKGVRRNVRVSAGLGAYVGLCGTIVTVSLPMRWLSGDPGQYLHYPAFPDSVPQWIRGTWGTVAQISLAAFALTPPFLLVGCGSLLFLRDWGRKILVGVFGVWMAVVMVGTAGCLAAVAFSGPDKLTFFSLPAANAAAGLLVYWLLLRSVRSPTVREVCRGYG